MAEFFPDSFSTDSSLDLPADQWTAEVSRAADYLAADEADRVTLQAGFEVDGAPYLITLIKAGVIDEYRLTLGRGSLKGSMRGRDGMAALLEQRFAKRYTANPPAETLSGTPSNTVEEVYGFYSASEIAAEVCEAVGLTLSWECRDYTILDRFDAIGRPIDILRSLVEPWSQMEPLRVDVFLQGETVICRGRALDPIPDATLGTISTSGHRLTAFDVRKFALPLVGELTLSGATIPGVGVDPTTGATGEGPPQPPPDPVTGGPSVTTPAGVWQPNTNYCPGDTVEPTAPVGLPRQFVATLYGTSGAVEPTWPIEPGATVQDFSQVWAATGAPADGTAPEWTPNTPLDVGDVITPTSDNGLQYTVTTPGTTGLTEPTWNPTLGGYTVDGSVIYGNSAINPANQPPPPGSMPFTGPNIWSYGTTTVDEVSEGFGPGGTAKTVVRTRTTYRTPDLVALSVDKTTTTDGNVTSRSLKVSSWDFPEMGPSGPSGGAVLRSEEETVWGWVTIGSGASATRQFVVIEHKLVTFSYDALRFLKMQVTATEKRNETSGHLDETSELETKAYKTEGALWVKITTERYTLDTNTRFWTKVSHEESIASGQRPGGIQSGGGSSLVIVGFPPAPPASGGSQNASGTDPDPYRPPASGTSWVPAASAGSGLPPGSTWAASAWPPSGEDCPWWPPEDFAASGFPPDCSAGSPGGSGVDPGEEPLDPNDPQNSGMTLTLAEVLSDDPRAQPLTYSNSNLSMRDLEFIRDQVRACQGLWQVEMAFAGLGFPWLRRGFIVQFVDIETDDGTSIPVPAGIVQQVRLSYDEGQAMIRDGKAIGWEA